MNYSKNWVGRMSGIIFAIGLFLVLSPVSEAQAASTAKTQQVTLTATEVAPCCDIVFDGKGKLDAINPAMLLAEEDTKNLPNSLFVVIGGIQEKFSNDIKIYHYLSQTVTVDDLLPGMYVGFRKDPSDDIVELWIVEPESQVVESQSSQNQSAPDAVTGNAASVKKVNGVWEN